MRSLRTWWKKWVRPRIRPSGDSSEDRRPLREFVYLDEVSLRSLLTSQLDTLPEAVTRAMSIAEESELTGRIAGGSEHLAKGEVGSRFKTANSNSIQTSRKAVAQTQFNEFRYSAWTPLSLTSASCVDESIAPEDLQNESMHAVKVSDLARGTLLEVTVELAVDPVFQFGTMLTEWAAMAEDYPAMFGASAPTFLNETVPINKVLQRLLAGLIPIRCTAVDLVHVVIDGEAWLLKEGLARRLQLIGEPVEFVGVTEHIGYWKDIRRVLFSDSTMTMMCRVARPGVQPTWTPVKLADLFRSVAPELVAQLSHASRAGVGGTGSNTPSGDSQTVAQLVVAVLEYTRALEEGTGLRVASETGAVERALAHIQGQPNSPTAQRMAFAEVRRAIDVPEADWTAEQDLVARQRARAAAGIPVIEGAVVAPFSEQKPPTAGAPNGQVEGGAPKACDKLVDVEVVAIYW